jgi:hypothetical protein
MFRCAGSSPTSAGTSRCVSPRSPGCTTVSPSACFILSRISRLRLFLLEHPFQAELAISIRAAVGARSTPWLVFALIVDKNESPIRRVFVKSHSNCAWFLLLPSVLGTLQSERESLRSGHRFAHKFCSALRTLCFHGLVGSFVCHCRQRSGLAITQERLPIIANRVYSRAHEAGVERPSPNLNHNWPSDTSS